MSLNCGHQQACCLSSILYMSTESHGGMILTVKSEELGENYSSATVSSTDATWTDPGANTGLRGKRPATISLSHGTARDVLTLAVDGASPEDDLCRSEQREL
jgi:hypothetical protein